MGTHLLKTPHYKTKAATPAYRDGWENVFGEPELVCDDCGLEIVLSEQAPRRSDEELTALASCPGKHLDDDD